MQKEKTIEILTKNEYFLYICLNYSHVFTIFAPNNRVVLWLRTS